MVEKDNNYCYKGVYYFYKDNVWYLFDDWEVGYVFTFNSDVYRLDECFNYIESESIKLATPLEKEFINKLLKID